MGLVGLDLPMKEVCSEPLPIFYSEHYNKSEQMREFHRMSRTKYYCIWIEIKSKCKNKNAHSYHKYGQRGINICNEWDKSFLSFYKYISLLDNFNINGYSIDRINNDGNYEPCNIRFANALTQATNTRIRINNKSGYTGIFYRKDRNTYSARIKNGGKYLSLGCYPKLKDAIIARNNYIINNNAPHKIQT